jgi:hypothetical protein
MTRRRRAYQHGAATSIGVTGQSGQSKLCTVGERRPGGPATAEPDDSDVRRAGSCTALRPGPEQHGSGPAVKPALGRTSSPCAQPQPEARSGLGWPESTKRWTGTTCLTASLTCVH